MLLHIKNTLSVPRSRSKLPKTSSLLDSLLTRQLLVAISQPEGNGSSANDIPLHNNNNNDLQKFQIKSRFAFCAVITFQFFVSQKLQFEVSGMLGVATQIKVSQRERGLDANLTDIFFLSTFFHQIFPRFLFCKKVNKS